jgi:hypothetical protein
MTERILVSIIILAAVALSGCGGGGNPVLPNDDPAVGIWYLELYGNYDDEWPDSAEVQIVQTNGDLVLIMPAEFRAIYANEVFYLKLVEGYTPADRVYQSTASFQFGNVDRPYVQFHYDSMDQFFEFTFSIPGDLPGSAYNRSYSSVKI